jgi:hypothetical protein
MSGTFNFGTGRINNTTNNQPRQATMTAHVALVDDTKEEQMDVKID